MEDEVVELVNWLKEKPSEYRRVDDELLAFIWHSDLSDLADLLKEANGDYFTDGAMKLEFNGEDIIFDAMVICSNFGINPKLIYPDYKSE